MPQPRQGVASESVAEVRWDSRALLRLHLRFVFLKQRMRKNNEKQKVGESVESHTLV